MILNIQHSFLLNVHFPSIIFFMSGQDIWTEIYEHFKEGKKYRAKLKGSLSGMPQWGKMFASHKSEVNHTVEALYPCFLGLRAYFMKHVYEKEGIKVRNMTWMNLNQLCLKPLWKSQSSYNFIYKKQLQQEELKEHRKLTDTSGYQYKLGTSWKEHWY